MLNILKVLPLAVLITACTSSFSDQAPNAMTYQEAIQQSPQTALGKTIVVGGPIVSYTLGNHSTQIEIANSLSNKNDAPSHKGNMNERVIINIPECISPEQLQNVRISAIGTITDIATLTRYGNSTILMISADQYKVWRTAKPMFDPNNKERYGYTYKFE